MLIADNLRVRENLFLESSDLRFVKGNILQLIHDQLLIDDISGKDNEGNVFVSI